MTHFNVVQRERRAYTQQKKRQLHGQPGSGKLKQRSNSVAISGKRKRKLFNKWRRDQKEAVQKGLITMGDVEMAVAEGTSQELTEKSQSKIHLKKGSKLRMKRLKGKGKSKNKSTKPAKTKTSTDAMVE